MELQGEDLAGEGAEEAAAIVSIVGNHGHAGQAADKVTCSELGPYGETTLGRSY